MASGLQSTYNTLRALAEKGNASEKQTKRIRFFTELHENIDIPPYKHRIKYSSSEFMLEWGRFRGTGESNSCCGTIGETEESLYCPSLVAWRLVCCCCWCWWCGTRVVFIKFSSLPITVFNMFYREKYQQLEYKSSKNTRNIIFKPSYDLSITISPNRPTSMQLCVWWDERVHTIAHHGRRRSGRSACVQWAIINSINHFISIYKLELRHEIE